MYIWKSKVDRVVSKKIKQKCAKCTKEERGFMKSEI